MRIANTGKGMILMPKAMQFVKPPDGPMRPFF